LTFFPRSQERIGEVKGDFQGGSIDILTYEEVADWGAKMQEIRQIRELKQRERYHVKLYVKGVRFRNGSREY
jgi:hypothetical protein